MNDARVTPSSGYELKYTLHVGKTRTHHAVPFALWSDAIAQAAVIRAQEDATAVRVEAVVCREGVSETRLSGQKSQVNDDGGFW